MNHLIATVVLNRLDYCNSLLAGQPRLTIIAAVDSERHNSACVGPVTTWPLQSGTHGTALAVSFSYGQIRADASNVSDIYTFISKCTGHSTGVIIFSNGTSHMVLRHVSGSRPTYYAI